MVKAYIGIANSYGLESFLADGEDVAIAISSGAGHGCARHRAYYWAAVRDDVASDIYDYLRAGDRHQALLTLDSLATDIAPLERVRSVSE